MNFPKLKNFPNLGVISAERNSLQELKLENLPQLERVLVERNKLTNKDWKENLPPNVRIFDPHQK
jgi:Leucine-rich repeat (LRR) protein